ncbi:3-deoxy-D-manno-octulosonic acid transferase [Mucilaginibacter jinjuensis]|uniref:3-deoxy-D-manno-octulosonic acid transferase n=1 Tax=Mucilaginibacter jinjuensis TaxID=1176721 RepID=A0ABY7T602_9SPHI|nr:glycosyltransferase N-terminal domain-containing protein [Mucilaginibacter jinjuensis]WCT11679.1 glycosyltransferase N-terminal domain-containing protein [Mucilaginibacter jinjuensis]
MLLLYNIGIRLYFLAVYAASFFNAKAKLWIKGRSNQHIATTEGCIWFHFASLGEFEQGRPVLEALRAKDPGTKIVITFFSPSGYEIRKNTPLADAVYYLPLDTATNARNFINTIKPKAAIFTKYEYWYHYFNQLHQQHTPLYIVSGIFRPKQIFFKWYGGLHRSMLKMATHFFVQDEASVNLLKLININTATVSGDTRFDRVWANANSPKELPIIAEFKNNQKVFIAGSTWPQDEELLSTIITRHPDWKWIIAPHEIGEERIVKLLDILPSESTIRFSQITDNRQPITDNRILIIDNIGMLSSLYQYGEVAYIGGGFGRGIHNTLEAAAFGLPVIFGPNYSAFKEARDIVHLKAGISISNAGQLIEATDLLMLDTEYRGFASQKIKAYVQQNVGATDKILEAIG